MLFLEQQKNQNSRAFLPPQKKLAHHIVSNMESFQSTAFCILYPRHGASSCAGAGDLAPCRGSDLGLSISYFNAMCRIKGIKIGYKTWNMYFLQGLTCVNDCDSLQWCNGVLSPSVITNQGFGTGICMEGICNC